MFNKKQILLVSTINKKHQMVEQKKKTNANFCDLPISHQIFIG